jgi:hypothetical protein
MLQLGQELLDASHPDMERNVQNNAVQLPMSVNDWNLAQSLGSQVFDKLCNKLAGRRKGFATPLWSCPATAWMILLCGPLQTQSALMCENIR